MSDPEAAKESTIAIIDMIFSGAVAAAAIFAACTARQALTAWKAEAKWRDDRDLARRLVVACIGVRQGIDVVRNSMQFDSEYPEDWQGRPPQTGKDRRVIQEYIYTKRIEFLLGKMQALEAPIVEAWALWGSDIHDRWKDLFRLYNTLRFTAFRWVADNDPSPGEESLSGDTRKKLREIVQAAPPGSNSDDTFGRDFAAAVDAIEQIGRSKVA